MSSSYVVDNGYVPIRLTPAVRWLVGINVLVYFLQVTAVGTPDMEHWLGFAAHDFTRQWWTIFTYMFVHAGFWHLTVNMIALWAFGPKVERAWGSSAFVRYYLLCGMGGWLTHLLVARDSILVGASAAIFGVMLAYAVRWPNDEFLLWWVVPVKAKWLVACLALFNLVVGVYALGSVDAGVGTAYFAHLGGLAAGWLYLHTPPAHAFERFRQRVAAAPDVPDEPPRAIPRAVSRPRSEVDEIVAKSKAAVLKQRQAPATVTPPPAATHTRTTAQVDLVLDKISRHGIESLTDEERRILEETSRQLRQE